MIELLVSLTRDLPLYIKISVLCFCIAIMLNSVIKYKKVLYHSIQLILNILNRTQSFKKNSTKIDQYKSLSAKLQTIIYTQTSLLS